MTHREHQDEQKRRPDLRRILTGGLAILLEVALLFPMPTTVLRSTGVVTPRGIEAIGTGQRKAPGRQDQL